MRDFYTQTKTHTIKNARKQMNWQKLILQDNK